MRIVFILATLISIASAGQCKFYIDKLYQDLYAYKEAEDLSSQNRILGHIEKNLIKIKQHCKGK